MKYHDVIFNNFDSVKCKIITHHRLQSDFLFKFGIIRVYV